MIDHIRLNSKMVALRINGDIRVFEAKTDEDIERFVQSIHNTSLQFDTGDNAGTEVPEPKKEPRTDADDQWSGNTQNKRNPMNFPKRPLSPEDEFAGSKEVEAGVVLPFKRKEETPQEEGITVEYDGEYPNTCRGTLTIKIDGKVIYSSKHCCRSTGGTYFDEEGGHITHGDLVWEDADQFPQEIQDAVADKLSEYSACCGGCL